MVVGTVAGMGVNAVEIRLQAAAVVSAMVKAAWHSDRKSST
jgi:hypothetical protein